MSIKPQDASRVNLRFARLLRALALTIVSLLFLLLAPFCAFSPFAQRTKRYPVPNTPPDEKPRTAAFGYFDDGILRSVRTSDGRRYDGDEIAFLISVLDEAENDGLDDLEIVVNYRKTQTQTTYATTIEYLRQQGRRTLGVSGWELTMPRCMWSIDGNPPTGPQKQLQPAATQGALFDYAESAQRRGGY